jgi:hypothetical protein
MWAWSSGSPEAPEGLRMHRKKYGCTGRGTDAPEDVRMHRNKESLYYYTSVYIYSCSASCRTASLSFSAMADDTQQHTLFILQHLLSLFPILPLLPDILWSLLLPSSYSVAITTLKLLPTGPITLYQVKTVLRIILRRVARKSPLLLTYLSNKRTTTFVYLKS